jgi:hypothetical protein
LRAILIPAVAALTIGGMALNSSTRTAEAEPTTPPAASVPAQAADAPAPEHPFMRWQHGERWLHWRMARLRMWGLFYPVDDKHLSADDVQKIAEAMLLRHGNHSWKVINVAANSDNTVSFAYATADGSVIAHFSMDTKTGRLQRIG